MAYTQRLAWETLRTTNAAAFAGAYVALGSPLLFPGYIVKMVNDSNVGVTVSIDGATDIDVCPAGSYWLYDEGKVGQSSAMPALPAGTQIYVKGAVGAGTVYLVSQYVLTN
jgi:hypothetical protein